MNCSFPVRLALGSNKADLPVFYAYNKSSAKDLNEGRALAQFIYKSLPGYTYEACRDALNTYLPDRAAEKTLSARLERDEALKERDVLHSQLRDAASAQRDAQRRIAQLIEDSRTFREQRDALRSKPNLKEFVLRDAVSVTVERLTQALSETK